MGKIDPSLLRWVCPVNPRFKNKCYQRKAKNIQKSKKLLAYQQFIKDHMKNRKFKNLDSVNDEMKKLGKLWKNKKRR